MIRFSIGDSDNEESLWNFPQKVHLYKNYSLFKKAFCVSVDDEIMTFPTLRTIKHQDANKVLTLEQGRKKFHFCEQDLIKAKFSKDKVEVVDITGKKRSLKPFFLKNMLDKRP